MENQKDSAKLEILSMTSDIVCSYIAQNSIAAEDLPILIKQVYTALEAPDNVARSHKRDEPLQPAVPIDQSIQNDFIICLEDGKKLKMLKRYLNVNFGMTPEDYRQRWGLPEDYPMVSPNYSKTRSSLAKDIGLGLASPQRAEKDQAPRKRGRPKKHAA